MTITTKDIFNIFAREKAKQPDTWEVYHFQIKDQRDGYAELMQVLTGCIPDGVYRSGKRKGEPRYSKPLPGTKLTVITTREEFEKWTKEFLTKNGYCIDCSGKGTSYGKTCGVCDGTGTNV